MTEERITKAIEIIHGYEGLGGYNAKLGLYFPYQGKADKQGVITIGRGHVLNSAELQKTHHFWKGLTLAQCDALFEADLKPRIERLEKALGKWTPWQFAGALSMFYNIEEAWTPGKTPYTQHRAGDRNNTARGMLRYIYSAGKPRLGLWRRRMSEALCYCTGEVLIAKDSSSEARLEKRLFEVLPLIIKPAALY